MRRADRLFEIIQILRSARGPVTAAQLARDLEVTPRTVYRDMAALQSLRVPIEGSPGFGYLMRDGYDLPPLMFSVDEIEAIVVGLGLIRRTGDKALEAAAQRVASKVATAMPEPARRAFEQHGLFSSDWGAPAPQMVDPRLLRRAIREERKLRVAYRDEQGVVTERTLQPFAMVYYANATLVAAWCELRDDFRHFRVDRICACDALDEGFSGQSAGLRAAWLESQDIHRHGT